MARASRVTHTRGMSGPPYLVHSKTRVPAIADIVIPRRRVVEDLVFPTKTKGATKNGN